MIEAYRDFSASDSWDHLCVDQGVLTGESRTVQEYLGHSTIQVTEKYSHLSQSHKREAIEVLNFSRNIETNLKQLGGRGREVIDGQSLKNAEGGI
ncbi:MAG: hypothetical protein WBF13_01355 [Candidatus Zixiibacteriota bacterium]